MKKNVILPIFATLLLGGACAIEEPEPDEPVETEVFEKPDQFEQEDEQLDDKVLEVIEVAEGLQRHVTEDSMEPTAEFTTRTGSYMAIWVMDDGSSAVFEGAQIDGKSALKESTADSPLELFEQTAPDNMEVPAGLSQGKRFSVLEAEAAARLAEMGAEDLAMVEEEVDSAAPSQQARAASTCSKSAANTFYNNYRPGVLDNSEGVNEYTNSNFQYREARRRKDYQAFFQTSYNQWTPMQAPGGIQAAYFRASVNMCSGWGRLTMWRCLSSQGTANNGCGENGSTIGATFGPFVVGSGGNGTYKDWPGGDLGRARLDQMGSSDLAQWSVMASNAAYGSINDCYN